MWLSYRTALCSIMLCDALVPLTPRSRRRHHLTRVASSSTDIVAKAMGPNADRAIQLLREAADDLEPREAYVFEPEGPVEGVAHFIGGAALGTFPQVAYKALLTRVAQRCGVAVVATPFDLTLDHDAAARTCRTAFRAEAARWRGLPRYGIGHSLGAKLLLLIACDDADAYEKLVLLAPNNSGVADSARLLERLDLVLRRDSRPAAAPSVCCDVRAGILQHRGHFSTVLYS